MDEHKAARYLEQRVTIPESLRHRFDGVDHMSRSRMAEALSKQVGLRSDHQPVLVVGLLQILLESLARSARQDSIIERGGVEIASAVVNHFTLDECVAVAEYFGWSDQHVEQDTTLEDLSRVVHGLLGERIGAHLAEALVHEAQTSGPQEPARS